MASITLDDRDEAILERRRAESGTVESLADDMDCNEEDRRGRLQELVDNGLLRRIDDGDRYTLTDNGERATAASTTGTRGNRIDTPEDVERRLASAGLRADRISAVRAAFSVLRYWGDATTGELVAAVYSEHPVGVDSSEAWWNEVVRDHLRALPRVESPGPSDRYWRYAGMPTVEKPTDDGRVAPGDASTSPGSVRLALERLDCADSKRAAVRAAFDHLVREGEASAAALKAEVFPDEDAGWASAEEWWSGCVKPAFECLPDVVAAADAGDRWRLRNPVEGSMSSDPGADDPDGPLSPPGDGAE